MRNSRGTAPDTTQDRWADTIRRIPPDGTRVPYAVFTDPAVYAREQERIFRGATWSFLALEAEIPKPGDYKSTFIGDTPVVAVRAEDGTLHAWVNRCAHRGAQLCRYSRGNAQDFVCVYHQWSYDLKGNLLGVPFRRGYKSMRGMPDDFNVADHGLQRLRVESYRGIVFATFSPDVASLHDYLGADMRPWLDRVFKSNVVYLGCLRQYSRSNWKLYYENVKDGYHATLLHLFHNTFNIGRVNMKIRTVVDRQHGLHSLLQAARVPDSDDAQAYRDNKVTTFKEHVRLNDPEVIRMREEFDEPVTNHIQSIFPSLVVQQIHNTLACRQLLPKGPGEFELVFHLFGYEDDDEELRNMRVLQANLVGPAGYISMEDTEATELVQRAVASDPAQFSTLLMGQNDEGLGSSIITEEYIRRLWLGYKRLMEA